MNKPLQIASGGLNSGISSTIVGGNYWKCAAIGFAVGLLNHAAHAFVEGGPGDPPKKRKERAKQIIREAKSHLQNRPELYEDKWYIPDLFEENYSCFNLADAMSTGKLIMDEAYDNRYFETRLKTSFFEVEKPTYGSIITYRNNDGRLTHVSIYIKNNFTFSKPGNILPPRYGTINSDAVIYGNYIKYYNPIIR